jgi:hypothetical protein
MIQSAIAARDISKETPHAGSRRFCFSGNSRQGGRHISLAARLQFQIIKDQTLITWLVPS